jgi:pilus assembly protein TadC
MTSQTLAVLTFAAALLVFRRDPGSARLHALFTGSPGAVPAGPAFGLPVILRRIAPRPSAVGDPVELAAMWAELAVCLEAGMPVAAAVTAAADPLDGSAGIALRRAAGLLELGGDPAEAWRPALDDPSTGTFARAAARSAATGAALARTARAESTRVRDALADLAEARAQRAGVLIAAPLGLCFLPAFLVLGVAPVVIGLAGEVLAPW